MHTNAARASHDPREETLDSRREAGNLKLTRPLTVGHLVRPLALLVDDDDYHQDNDLGQNAQEGPERSQVTAHPEDAGHGGGADDVGGVAPVLARVRGDV